MFYDKDYALIKPKRKSVALSGFKGYDETKISTDLPCDYVDTVYNFKFKNGRLVNPYGVNELDVNGAGAPPIAEEIRQKDKRLFCTKTLVDGKPASTLVLTCENGVDYARIGDAAWTHIDCTGFFTSGVCYLYGEDDLLILSGDAGIKVFKNGELLDVEYEGQIEGLCVHYERIYAIAKGTRNSLWFSDNFDPFNWNVSIDEGGYINFDGTLGEVRVLKSFINYLYIFCDYGIYRLTAFADQNQFSMKKVYTSCGRIYAPTITDCGEYIAFASEDGVYLFDGYDVTRYSVKANDLIMRGFDDVCACYQHHKYVLSFTNTDGGDYGVFTRDADNNVLLLFDLTDKSVNIMRGISFCALQPLNTSDFNRIIGLSDDSDKIVQLDESGLYLGKSLQKYWQSPEVDFGAPSVIKVLRNVEYSTPYRYVLGIIANDERREFVLTPEENKIHLYVKAQSFVFYIRSDNVVEDIRPPVFTVDFMS